MVIKAAGTRSALRMSISVMSGRTASSSVDAESYKDNLTEQGFVRFVGECRRPVWFT